MARLKCKKCGAVFEKNYAPFDSAVRLGPLRLYKCPACGKRSFFNLMSSVKDQITYPEREKSQEQQTVETQPTEEELEKKRIEESKYEKA